MKVDFFILGGPKCGTTAMAQYLDDREDVCFSRPKETWHFSNDIYPMLQKTKNINDYHSRFFPHYNPDLHLCVGEGTPLYLFSQVAINNILEYNEQSKFIVMLRNPVDMAYSFHSQLVYNGRHHENIIKFPVAWNMQRTRARGHSLPHRVKEPSVLQYKDVCSLGSQMKRLIDRVSKERIHVILFDDFKMNTAESYKQTVQFLGLLPDDREVFERVNANKEWLDPASKVLYKKMVLIKDFFRFSFNSGLFDAFRNKRVKTKKRDPLPVGFRRQLIEEFRSEIELLSEQISGDLSHWLICEKK